MKVARGQLHRISGAVQRKPHGERVREGDTPSCWGGGGHGKFLNFAYPEMHSGAFSGQKSVRLEVIVN